MHIPPPEPMGNWDTAFGLPWWRNGLKYQVGLAVCNVGFERCGGACVHVWAGTCMAHMAMSE